MDARTPPVGNVESKTKRGRSPKAKAKPSAAPASSLPDDNEATERKSRKKGKKLASVWIETSLSFPKLPFPATRLYSHAAGAYSGNSPRFTQSLVVLCMRRLVDLPVYEYTGGRPPVYPPEW